MAETEEKERKKKRGGLGEFLQNREALYALGSGFSAASRGGDFAAGLGRGLADWGAIQDRNAAREMAHLEARNAEQQRQRMAAFRDTLSADQQALFDLDPKAWTGAEIKAAHATAAKGTGSKQKYDELLAMGVDPSKAFNMAYGTKSMRIRTNPDGTMEFYEGFGDEEAAPKLREQEAKFGLYAAQALDSHKQMTDLEKTVDPSSAGNAAYTILRETPGLGRFGELIPNEEMKQYDAEAGRFIDGWARAMTGAAMPDSERVFYKTMIGVRPGDGPDVKARKARNREIMARSLQAGAGVGGDILDRVKSQMVDPYDGTQNAPSAGGDEWTDEKEQRYQELMRKKQEGSLQ